jgi:hypothetical protein
MRGIRPRSEKAAGQANGAQNVRGFERKWRGGQDEDANSYVIQTAF